MNSKVDFKSEDVDYTVPVQETRTRYDVKREWDHLLERNGEEIPGQEEEYWAKYVNAYKPTTGMFIATAKYWNLLSRYNVLVWYICRLGGY